MALALGATVWIPCEVKPGPFSNERLVRVDGRPEPWVGFVPVWYLREPLDHGATEVRAVVAALHDDRFLARIPGHAVRLHVVEQSLDRAKPLGPLPA